MTYDKMKNVFELIEPSVAIKNNRQRYRDTLANNWTIQQLGPISEEIAISLNCLPNTVVTMVSTSDVEENYSSKGIPNFIQFNTIDFTEAEFLKVMWDVTVEEYGIGNFNMTAITISSRLQPIYISRNDNETWAIYYTIYFKSYNKTETNLYLSIIKSTVQKLLKIKGK